MRADEASAIKEKVRRLPESPGVYLMKDRLGQVIYVGKAKSLKKRVSSYFQPSRKMTLHPKIRQLVQVIHDFETIDVRSEPEALLLEGKLIKQFKPRYNTDFTDDKRFPLVRVDLSESLPRFRLTRFKKDDGARYFGPFAHSGLLRRTLAQMRKEFGILLADSQPQSLGGNQWKLYDDVRSELYGHDNEVSEASYRERVEHACNFLVGKSREWLADLRAEMQDAAEAQEFERAAELRDILLALEKTLEPTRKFERDRPLAPGTDQEALELQAALGLREPPKTLECFDISHISGTFVVASMVHFREGRPEKQAYRRFRIRSFIGNDDFRAMEEVVGRRYSRLLAESRPMPDLIVIDGGLGQIGAALRAFAAIGATPPALIGLAKKAETIIRPDGLPPINLPLNNPGLRLLIRIRDEAHRFANTYNADLRSQRIRESILDDFDGLGPKRKQLLLARFGSIDALMAASPGQIEEVDGIGPKLASDLHAFLGLRRAARERGSQAGS